jgi:hypothetical protein
MPTFTPIITTIPYRPIATPSAKESSKMTLELLRTNNGCDLPCWWGITPNQTSWSDAKQFLKPFSTIYERQPSGGKWDVYDVHSTLPLEFSDVFAVRTVFAAQKGIVKEIESGYFDEKTFHLSPFLLKYGIPNQIFISSYSSDSGMPKNTVPFTIALYYPKKGIMATYATNAKVMGSKIVGCFDKSPSLFLWSPDEHDRSMDYILGWDKRHTPYLEIEPATGLKVDSFYATLSNPGNKACLETSTSLWPSQ